MLATVDWFLVAPVVALAALGFGVVVTEVRDRLD